MRIIVNSDREKQVIETFSDFIADWVDSDEMRQLIKKAEYNFEEHELELIQSAFHSAIHNACKEEAPTYLEAENLTGFCKICGDLWQGLVDEYELKIEEYEDYLNSTETICYKCSEAEEAE